MNLSRSSYPPAQPPPGAGSRPKAGKTSCLWREDVRPKTGEIRPDGLRQAWWRKCAQSFASDEMSPLADAQDACLCEAEASLRRSRGPRRSPKGEGGFQRTAGMPAGLHKLSGLALAVFFFFFSQVQAEQQAMPSASLDTMLAQARKLVAEGEWLAAKEKYKALLSNTLEPNLKRDIEKEFESLNFSLLFSSTITPDAVLYEVKPGDSLYKIAKAHNTTAGLIAKINGLKGSTIYSGMKLKVVAAKFSILVSRSRNLLFLREGDEIIKTYRIATGQNSSTPLGTFTIENKLIHPTWYRAGAVVPPDSSDNVLGSRWMGFSIAGYGIHGTTTPESIGTSVSAGCIRMLNQDVEELYDIVPLKTIVAVVD